MRVALAEGSEAAVMVLWFVQTSVRNCVHGCSACDDQTSVADGTARLSRLVAVAGWTKQRSLTRR